MEIKKIIEELKNGNLIFEQLPIKMRDCEELAFFISRFEKGRHFKFISERLKNDEWRYEDMNNNNILQVKEILKKFYAQKKVINDKLLKKPGKKWQELIDAYLWLNA